MRSRRLWLRGICGLIIILLVAQPVAAQRASELLDFGEIDNTMYEPKSGLCDASSSGGSVSELDGHKIPAAEGYTGNEDPVDENGNLTTTGEQMAFGKYAKLGQEYRDYYITMRWGFVKWNWDGTSVSGGDTKMLAWLNEKPRLVVVTNKRNGKSIIAVVMESGPAPWTGTKAGPGNPPSYWRTARVDSPTIAEGYKGRVAGFPPKARDALDAKQGEADGTRGDVLTYAWAKDQKAKPGPVAGTGTAPNENATPPSSGSICGNSGAYVNPDGYAMPIGLKKQDIGNWCKWPVPESPKFCHHNESNPGQGSPAFDLAHNDTINKNNSNGDAKSVGVPEYAIYDGQLRGIDVYRNTPGCYEFHLVGKDGWDYYYTHAGKVTQPEGKPLKAGDQVSVIGQRKCTGNDSPPHLHIDRGSPKGQGGGRECCRDFGFPKLMNAIYKAMP